MQRHAGSCPEWFKPMRSNLKRSIVIHRKITWLLLFSIVSLAIASWFIYTGKKTIERTNARINQTYEIIETLQETITVVVTSETLPPRYLDSLQQLTKENNDLRSSLQLLHNHVDLKWSGADIRTLLQSMLQEEKKLLADRKTANERANQRTTYGLLIGRAAAFLFVVIILLMLNKDITRHKATQQRLMLAIQ